MGSTPPVACFEPTTLDRAWRDSKAAVAAVGMGAVSQCFQVKSASATALPNFFAMHAVVGGQGEVAKTNNLDSQSARACAALFDPLALPCF